MTKYLTLVTACLLAFAPARAALGQADSAPSSGRLEVVISRFVGETKVGSQPFSFLLKTGEKGSLRIESTDSADSDATKPCAAQKVPSMGGTQVDARIRPEADDRFSVELTITERAFSGCRTVGNVSIPVISNRIIGKTVTLKSGETTKVDLSAPNVRNEAMKIDVTLTMK